MYLSAFLCVAVSLCFLTGCGSAAMPTPEPSSKVIRAGKTININTADIGELKDLPDVGEATAKKIVAFREANGPFQNVESIMLIDGISEKRFRRIEPFITTQ